MDTFHRVVQRSPAVPSSHSARDGAVRRPMKRRTQVGLASSCLALLIAGGNLLAQDGPPPPPTLTDPDLGVRTVLSGLTTPTTMAFVDRNAFFILEKNTGKVKHVVDGVVVGEVLDLPVNFASERGLLGIALHPRFRSNHQVYLFWTERESEAPTGIEDTDDISDVPLLGNRVDRFVWDEENGVLIPDIPIIQLRARQADATNVDDQGNLRERGNHDGGILKFGPDGKLFIFMGDNGRRGQMQNLPDGPGCIELPCPEIPQGNLPDDQFGGPEPDDAHLTGVILRLNDDGTTPRSNPFFKAGERRGGEAGENLQKVFAFGVRNGFGMAFDPFSGRLWDAQNGDDSFTEINLVEPGANLGWIQIMGPLSRLAEFKAIETSDEFFGLQQTRWPPTNIADSEREALERLFWVFEGGNEFEARLTGDEENPPVDTRARAEFEIELERDGTLEFRLRARRPINDVIVAHIHLGADGQNGPPAAFLFESAEPVDFDEGDTIARGELTDADIIERPGFTPTVANLVERMRQGRTYVNVHTTANPGGEIRGQLFVSDRDPVSHYSDPEFAWRFEIAPAGVGFIESRDLGSKYRGDLIVGAAVGPRGDGLLGGHLFRFELSENRRRLEFKDRALRDRVADNNAKYDATESESLIFGLGFGVGTDIQTAPNGNLYVVSLSNGEIYEIFRQRR